MVDLVSASSSRWLCQCIADTSWGGQSHARDEGEQKREGSLGRAQAVLINRNRRPAENVTVPLVVDLKLKLTCVDQWGVTVSMMVSAKEDIVYFVRIRRDLVGCRRL
jgi:hypothetical protein